MCLIHFLLLLLLLLLPLPLPLPLPPPPPRFLFLLHVIELERLRRVNDVDVGNDVLQILVRRHVSRR